MTVILDREFKMPADGWYQLAPLGTFRSAPVAGKVYAQVVDGAAVSAMTNRFKQDASAPGFGGMLVDFDHGSLDTGKSSRAAGWIEAIENRDSGLWGKIRWSKSGKEAVEGGDFRYLSPVWNVEDCEDLGGGRLRPMRLRRAAVTNDPNLRGMAPLTNRGSIAAEQEQAKEQGMKDKLVKLLGLAGDTADDAIVAGVGVLVNRAKDADTLQARVAEMESKELERQVETDLAEFAGVIANRDDVKAQLIANRESTLKVLKGLKKPEDAKGNGGTPLPNRRDGKAPEGDPGAAESAQGDRLAAAIRNRAGELQKTERISFSQAWTRASEEMAG